METLLCTILRSILLTGVLVQPTEHGIRAWLDAEAQRADRLDFPSPFAVRWTYENFCVLTPESLAALRSEVRDKPFHPRRSELEEAERQLRDGKSVTHMMWLRDRQGRWRFGIEYPGRVVQDTVCGPRDSWQMVNGTLKIFDHSVVGTRQDPAQNPLAEEHVFAPDLDAIFFGKLGSTRSSRLALTALHVDRMRWTAVFASASGAVEWQYSGRWSVDENRPFVESRRILKHPSPDWVGHVELFQDWKPFGDSTTWAASVVRRLDSDGREWRRVTSVEPMGLSPEEIEQAMRAPSHEAPDPIRGTAGITRRLDFRSRLDERVDAESGHVSATFTLPGASERQGIDKRRLLGWVVLASIAMMAAALHIRRLRVPSLHKETQA